MILFITYVSCPLRGPVLLNLPYWGLFSELEISLTRNLISIGSLVIIKSDGQTMTRQNRSYQANHSN